MSETYLKLEEEFVKELSKIQLKLSEADLTQHKQILSCKRDLHQAEKTLKQMEIEIAMLPQPSLSKHCKATKDYRQQWQDLITTVRDSEKRFYDLQNQGELTGSFASSAKEAEQAQLSNAEAVAVDTMQYLRKQREMLEKSQEGTRQIKSNLITSGNMIAAIERRKFAIKLAMIFIIFVLLVAILVLLSIDILN